MTDNESNPEVQAARRRRVRRNAILLALFAFTFYAGFILIGVMRA